MHRLPLATCVVAVAVLAGCSGTSTDPSPISSRPTPAGTSSPRLSSSRPATSEGPALTSPPTSTASQMPSTPAGSPSKVLPTIAGHDGFGTVNVETTTLTTSRGTADGSLPGIAGYWIEICAKGSTPQQVNPKAFKLTTPDGGTTFPQSATGYTPMLKAGSVAAGSCTQGFVNFDLASAMSDSYTLSWTDASGRAVWRFSG